VVAASAVAGYITGPQFFDQYPKLQKIVKTPSATSFSSTTTTPPATLLPGMPQVYLGRGLLCLDDNINTDGIYPGKYTYREDISPEQQAQVVMENYDTSFASKVHKGDILFTGFNFGTGSSREQAATALKHGQKWGNVVSLLSSIPHSQQLASL